MLTISKMMALQALVLFLIAGCVIGFIPSFSGCGCHLQQKSGLALTYMKLGDNAELAGQEDNFNRDEIIEDFAEHITRLLTQLLRNGHYATDEVKETMLELVIMLTHLCLAVDERLKEIQVLNNQVHRVLACE
jgi:hypothetical protein